MSTRQDAVNGDLTPMPNQAEPDEQPTPNGGDPDPPQNVDPIENQTFVAIDGITPGELSEAASERLQLAVEEALVDYGMAYDDVRIADNDRLVVIEFGAEE